MLYNDYDFHCNTVLCYPWNCQFSKRSITEELSKKNCQSIPQLLIYDDMWMLEASKNLELTLSTLYKELRRDFWLCFMLQWYSRPVPQATIPAVTNSFIHLFHKFFCWICTRILTIWCSQRTLFTWRIFCDKNQEGLCAMQDKNASNYAFKLFSKIYNVTLSECFDVYTGKSVFPGC